MSFSNDTTDVPSPTKRGGVRVEKAKAYFAVTISLLLKGGEVGCEYAGAVQLSDTLTFGSRNWIRSFAATATPSASLSRPAMRTA